MFRKVITVFFLGVLAAVGLGGLPSSVHGQAAVAPAGSGSAGSPYLIASLENLIWMQENPSALSGVFRQTADIDLISISNWTPIGTGGSFDGTFDGNGFVIRNLRIDRSSSDYQALFAMAGAGSLIQNVRLENVDIRGSRWVGGIAGRTRGRIEDSSVTGLVQGSREYVGGIVGQGSDASLDNKLVFIGEVVGGIVANETGTNVGIGGIVGRASGSTSVSVAYVRGTVRGNRAGGIVGSSSTANSTFSQIYATVDIGTVPGRSQSLGGAVVGRVESSGDVINNSVYWDTSRFANAYGEITAGSTRNAIGLTSTQMQGSAAQTNMSNLTWGGASPPWRTVTVPVDDFPVFDWQAGELVTISGRITGPSGEGLAGVTVTAQSSDSNFQSVTAVTNGNGDYSLQAFSTVTARVFARGTLQGLPVAASTSGPFPGATTVNLQLQPQSLTIGTESNAGWIRDGREIIAVESGAHLNVNTLRDDLLSGDVTVVAGLDLRFDATLAPALPATRSLTLRSGRDMIVAPNAAITPTGSALNLVFWSNIDGTEEGGVLFDLGTSIRSNNGHIRVSGGSSSTIWNGLEVGAGPAVGLTAGGANLSTTYGGINAIGASIHAGSGDLFMEGRSTQTDFRFGIGVRFRPPTEASPLEVAAQNITVTGVGSPNNNGSGDINRGNWGIGIENTQITGGVGGTIQLTGTGGGSTAGTNGGQNHGIRMDGISSIVARGGGSLRLVGTGGGNPSVTANGDNDGIRIDGGTLRVDSGDLVLEGAPGLHASSEGIQLTGATVVESGAGGTGSGSIRLSGDAVSLASEVRIRGQGPLGVEPLGVTGDGRIGVGTGSGTLVLPASYFATNFVQGFSGVVVGNASTAEIEVGGAVTYRDDLTLRTGGDLVLLGSASLTGASGRNASLVLWADANGSGSGMIWLRQEAAIQTQGGHLWLGGGAGSTLWNGLTVGDGHARAGTRIPSSDVGTIVSGFSYSAFNGITVDRASLRTGGGHLTLRGKSQDITTPVSTIHAYLGVLIQNGAELSAEGGAIDIEGITDGIVGSTSLNGLYYGTFLSSSDAARPTVVRTTSGPIQIQGEGSHEIDRNFGRGLVFRTFGSGEVRTETEGGSIDLVGISRHPGGTVVTTNQGIWLSRNTRVEAQSGALTLRGTSVSGRPGIRLESDNVGAFTLGGDQQTGPILFQTDGLEVVGTAGRVASAGTLRVEPETPGTPVGIGSGSGTLVVPASFFSTTVAPGVPSVEIGGLTAGNIEVGGALTYRSNLTLRTPGDLFVASGTSITGDAAQSPALILWADANGSGTGSIFVNTATVATGGGHLWMGGGAETTTWNDLVVGAGAARAGTEHSGLSNSGNRNGISIFQSALTTSGGHAALFGSSQGAGTSNGIYVEASTLETASGDLEVEGTSTNASLSWKYGVLLGTLGNNQTTALRSSSGALEIRGTSTYASGRFGAGVGLYSFGNAQSVVAISSESGPIRVEGTHGSTNNTDHFGGIFFFGAGEEQIVSRSGNITLVGTSATPSVAGINVSEGNTTSSIGFDGTHPFTGDIVLQSNTEISFEGDLTAGTLDLRGPGVDFALNSPANRVERLVANTAALGFRNTGALELGPIEATGGVDVRTSDGNLILEGPVSTTASGGSAMILAAGSGRPAGDETGGDIVVADGAAAPLLSVGSGGVIRLYSGSLDGSTGILDLNPDLFFGASEAVVPDPAPPSGTAALFRARTPFGGADGEGTPASPYRIRTVADLEFVRLDLGASYRLEADLVIPPGTPWTPIGTHAEPFTGTFDGGGREIRGLDIEGTNDLGLFGVLDGATVQDVTLQGTVRGNRYLGLLAGRSRNGTLITNVRAVVDLVSDRDANGVSDAGGLIGEASQTRITRSSTDGVLRGDGRDVGGLVGYLTNPTNPVLSSEIRESYSTVNITHTSNEPGTGGLVGGIQRGGSIYDSFASGEVQGFAEVGGLVGRIQSASGATRIERSYAAGKVPGSGASIGGLLGRDVTAAGITVVSSYWDTQTSGTLTSAAGEGRITAQMKSQATFEGWDFGTLWQIEEGITYPELQGLTPLLPRVNLIPSPGVGGAVLGGGNFVPGTQVTVTAVPVQGYEFDTWTNEAGDVVSESEVYVFTLGETDVTLQANFLTAFILTVDEGSEQSATVGTAVATPPSVRVTDGAGGPLAGVAVVFEVTGGGGSVEADSVLVTGSDGIAAVTSWILGTTAGTNELTARLVGIEPEVQVVFEAEGTPGAATGFGFTEDDGSPLATERRQFVPFGVRLTLLDTFGNETTAEEEVAVQLFWVEATGGEQPLRIQQPLGIQQPPQGPVGALAIAAGPEEGAAETPVAQGTLGQGASSVLIEEVVFTAEGGGFAALEALLVGGESDGARSTSDPVQIFATSFGVTAADAQIVADGESETVITAQLIETTSEAGIEGQAIRFSTTSGLLLAMDGTPLGETDVLTDEAGFAQVRLRAASSPAQAGVTARCAGGCEAEVSVRFGPGDPDPATSSVEASLAQAEANDEDEITLTVTLRDVRGVRVPGVAVQMLPVEEASTGRWDLRVVTSEPDGEADANASAEANASDTGISDDEGVVTFVVSSGSKTGAVVTFEAVVSPLMAGGTLILEDRPELTFVDVTPPEVLGQEEVVVEEGLRPISVGLGASEPVVWSLAAAPWADGAGGNGRSDADLARFEVEPGTGALSFAAEAEPGVYRVRVVGTDPAGNQGSLDVEVTVPSRPKITARPGSVLNPEPGLADLAGEVEQGARIVALLETDRPTTWSLVEEDDFEVFELDPQGVLRLTEAALRSAPLMAVGNTLELKMLAQATEAMSSSEGRLAELSQTLLRVPVRIGAPLEGDQGGCAPTGLIPGDAFRTMDCVVVEDPPSVWGPELRFEGPRAGEGVDPVLQVGSLVPAGRAEPLASGRLRLVFEGSLFVQGSALMPSQMVRGWLYGDPSAGPESEVGVVALGATPIEADGTIAARWAVPADLPAGGYTLLVASRAQSGEVVTVSAGVVLEGMVSAAPEGVDATAGNQTLAATWQAPEFDGASPITGYVVQVQRLDGSGEGAWVTWPETVGPDTRSLILDPVENLRQYRVRVAAVNAFGTGPWTLAPQVLAPVGPPTSADGSPLPAQDPGTAAGYRNGQAEDMDVQMVDGREVVAVPRSDTGVGFRVSATGGDGQVLPVNPEDLSVEVSQTGFVRASGEGFQPGTVVTVYIFSDPLLLGTLPVDARGAFDGELPLDPQLALGRHTLKVTGIDRQDTTRSLLLGLRLAPDDAPYVDPDAPEDADETGQFRPAAPTDLTMVTLDAAVELSWEGPRETETSGLPVLYYVLDVWVDNGATWERRVLEPGKDSPLRIADLENGRSYRFRLAAVTEGGASAFTRWTPAVVPSPALLEVEVALIAGAPMIGEEVTLEIRVRNDGLSRAEQVWLAQGLQDEDLDVVDLQIAKGEIEEDDQGRRFWRIGSLEAGEEVVLILTAIVVDPDAEGDGGGGLERDRSQDRETGAGQ